MLFFLQKLFSIKQYITKNDCPCHIQVLETRGRMLTALGHGLWPGMVIFSEIVQTFILADFCYYYVKRSVLSFSPVDDHLCFGFPRIVLHVV